MFLPVDHALVPAAELGDNIGEGMLAILEGFGLLCYARNNVAGGYYG